MWAHESGALWKPENMSSPEVEPLTPWSWTSSLQNCEKCLLFKPLSLWYRRPSWLTEECFKQEGIVRVRCFWVWSQMRTERYTRNLAPGKLLIPFVIVVFLKCWGQNSDSGVRDKNIRTMSAWESRTHTRLVLLYVWPWASLIHFPNFIFIICNLSSLYLSWRYVVRIARYIMEKYLECHEVSINADSFHFSHFRAFKINLWTRTKQMALHKDYMGSFAKCMIKYYM